jgi:hypothetical protein
LRSFGQPSGGAEDDKHFLVCVDGLNAQKLLRTERCADMRRSGAAIVHERDSDRRCAAVKRELARYARALHEIDDVVVAAGVSGWGVCWRRMKRRRQRRL